MYVNTTDLPNFNMQDFRYWLSSPFGLFWSVGIPNVHTKSLEICILCKTIDMDTYGNEWKLLIKSNRCVINCYEHVIILISPDTGVKGMRCRF